MDPVGGFGVRPEIHGFQVTSTEEQDARFIAIFNDRRNKGHFNMFFHNCADFSRVVLDIYLPHAIHRSIVADLGHDDAEAGGEVAGEVWAEASRSWRCRRS